MKWLVRGNNMEAALVSCFFRRFRFFCVQALHFFLRTT